MDGEREQGDMKTAATSHDCGMEQSVRSSCYRPSIPFRQSLRALPYGRIFGPYRKSHVSQAFPLGCPLAPQPC